MGGHEATQTAHLAPAKAPGTASDGLLVIDKPAGMTSHDVVARVRRLVGTRKVGHAGTLDPMATGVLLVGVNRATRLLTYLVGADKSYAATIRLGQRTHTDDAQGEQLPAHDPAAVARTVQALSLPAITAATAALTGEIEQVPSAVSAIKVGGIRSYARVRAGQEIELAARSVSVYRFTVGEPVAARTESGPVLDVPIEVEVSSGTYVRALARDLGAALGVGGHLISLRRTRVGAFGLDRAYQLGDLIQATSATSQAAHPPVPLLGLAQAAALVLPVRKLDAAQAWELGFGRPVESDPLARPGPIAGVGPDGALVAVLVEQDGRARAAAVFAPAAASAGGT